jgi:pyruvate ferredoxin oxidoreductase gamma subunit|tara:strand:+ start:1112 stop:1666 length:555 start_codon:yes stop_codon:yes gene_type:complete
VILIKEIRFHGRGGQGAVTAADILAVASFKDGKFCQAFPVFGTERRGAPVAAFVRISDSFIRIRSQIYSPDYVVVQDSSLIDVIDVADGLVPGGIILINTEKKAEELNIKKNVETYTMNATKIAIDILGVPIVNTTMLGGFAAITNLVTLKSLKDAINRRFPNKLAMKNVKAIEVAYNTVVDNL